MKSFIEVYSKISGLNEISVGNLLVVQDKQDTRYSRVKTCKELWDFKEQENKILKDILRDFLTTKECRTTWIEDMHATIADTLGDK